MATKIFINGQEAELQSNASFEYVSENPLFTEAEDYTFEIPFPLKDCPRNISIFGPLYVKGVDISKVSYPCEIRTDAFSKVGILTITEVNEVSVKAQFLEGMSTDRFSRGGLDMYIDEIDFSLIDGTNGESEYVMSDDHFVDLPVWDKDEDKIFSLFSDSLPVLRHIYLHELVDWIIFQAGMDDVDLSAIESSAIYQRLVVCNTTDNVTYAPEVFHNTVANGFYFMNIEKTLPHWTVREFLSELAKMFTCKAVFNGSQNSVRFVPVANLVGGSGEVRVVVLDDFMVEMQDGEDKMSKAVNFKFPDDCNPNNINNCPWIYDYIDSLKVLQLITQDQYNPTWLAQHPYADDIWYRRSRLYECVNSIAGVYGIVTEITKRDDITQYGNELHFVKFEVLNQFGSRDGAEELKIYPAALEWKRILRHLYHWETLGRDKFGVPGYVDTDATFANPYKMPVVSVVKYRPTEPTLDNEWLWSAGELVEKGSPKKEIKGIALVIIADQSTSDGSHLNTRKWEPQIGTAYAQETIDATEGIVPDYYQGIEEYPYSMTPGMWVVGGASKNEPPQVDETKLYQYKFLASSLPSATAIYVIKGKRYACLRLTAHFNIDGMSELIEGEFYEIVG